MNVNFDRARITTPDTILSPVRFVFLQGDGDMGTAAVWSEEKRPHRHAKRVLLATGYFKEELKSRGSNTFVVGEGQEWSVTQLTGGCGCNRGQSLLASLPLEQLVSPDFSSIDQ